MEGFQTDMLSKRESIHLAESVYICAAFHQKGYIPEEAWLVSQIVVLQNLSPLSLQLLQALLLFLSTIHVTLLQHPTGRET